MKVVGLPALSTGQLYPPGNIPGTHFRWRMSQLQGHCAVGRIMSVKNSNEPAAVRLVAKCFNELRHRVPLLDGS